MGANITLVTGGDLIRAALSEGSSELGLAKRLAGSSDDADPEVRRWRYVVRRARLGGEPNDQNLRRIAETFGADMDSLQRPQRKRDPDRLAALEAEVARLTAGQEEAQRAHDLLLERVEEIERRIQAGGQIQEHAAELAIRAAPTRRGRAAR